MSSFPLTRFRSLSFHAKHSKSFTLGFSTCRLAEKFYTLLQKSPNNIEKSLATVKVKLDSTCVIEVLHKCFPSQSQIGIRFFIWAGIQSNYRHSSFIYNKACELSKIRQNPGILADVIEAYRNEGCNVSVKAMRVLLILCEKAKLADEALWVLRKMPEFNLRADTVMYNAVIRLFCEKGDMVMADKLMKEMGLIDLYPDIITYVLMIKGFCNVDKFGDACALFKAMRRHGCEPNSVTLSTLLDGFCKFGNMEGALELLGEMEKQGGDCKPNVVTYTSVIQSFSEKGMIDEALGVLDRMEACGCAPNRVTISTLINGLCSKGNVEEVYKLIDKVVARGGVSFGDCYSSLVVSLVRVKRVEEAEKLFKRMLVSEVKPDGLASSVMIRQICLEGRLMDGFRLYEEIEGSGCLSSIDSDIYSMLLVGLCHESREVEVARLVAFMLEKRILLKAPYVDIVVKFLKESGDKELVTHLSRVLR